MRRLSRNDLENIGMRVFRDYSHLPDLAQEPVFCVNPLLLCERLLHLQVEYRTLSRFGTILGLTAFEPVKISLPNEEYWLDGRTVLIDSSLNTEDANIGRRNFTVSHEASHQILKMFFPNEYGNRPHECRRVQIHCCRADAVQRYPIQDWEEWQTNTLASAILLPRPLVIRAMKAVGLQGKIQRLNKLFNPDEFERFVTMSEILGSSRKALSIRMKQLGLIGEDYLDNPYRLVDVEVD